MVDRERGDDRVERAPLRGQRLVEVVLDDRDVQRLGEALADPPEHLGGEVGRDRLGPRAGVEHPSDHLTVTTAEVEHPRDALGEELEQRAVALVAVRDALAVLEVRLRVRRLRPTG